MNGTPGLLPRRRRNPWAFAGGMLLAHAIGVPGEPSCARPLAAWAGPGEATRSLRLEAGDLTEPDRAPPARMRDVAGPAFAALLGRAPGAAIGAKGLVLDADGDGKPEVNVLAGRSAVVDVTLPAGTTRLLLFERAGRWWASPARLLRARLPGKGPATTIELLDADLDGRFDGDGDLLRVGDDGAFFAPAPERRLPWGDDVWRLALVARGAAVPEARLTLEPHPEGLGAVERRGLGAVNAFRSRCGLAPLVLDARWSAGCARHAAYIQLNPVQGFGHAELPNLPGYSPEGHEAAVEGVMERTGDPLVAVERLTAMLMHRTPFLTDPTVGLGVGAVGLPSARATGPGPGSTGTAGFCVLRAGVALGSKALPVLVPGPGQRNVPLTLLPEVPTPDPRSDLYARPRGYAISVSFLPRSGPPPTLTLRVVGAPKPVPCSLFTPGSPLHPSFAHNYATAFLVPDEALLMRTTYEVECRLGEGTEAPHWVWRFTTRGL